MTPTGTVQSDYKYSFYRGEKCKHCGLAVPVFGLGYLAESGGGEFEEKGLRSTDNVTSKKLNKFYLDGDKEALNYFVERFVLLYEERFKGDINFDYVGIVPSHEKGDYNPNLAELGRALAERLGITFKLNLIERTRTTKEQHKINNKSDRIANVKGSMKVNGDVKDKNILIVDNTVVTGAHALEIFEKLQDAGAKWIVFFCIALGNKAKKGDFDLNPSANIKASEIITKLHWPKADQQARLLHKAEQKHEDLPKANPV